MLTSINPANAKPLKTYTLHKKDDIENTLASAQNAFQTWRQTALKDRVRHVHTFADTLENNREDIARTMSLEMGKTIVAGRAEIDKCVSYCRYTADMARHFLRKHNVKTQYKATYTKPLPLGAILLVMPWNFPFWQVIRVAIAAILSGNTCVLKHASNVPACALLLEKHFFDAGFPNGVFSTLLVNSNMVAKIIADPRIKGASLTGSEHAGAAVASACGQHIKPCVLELGGSDPFIVMPSADLEQAIDHAITGRMRNNGQSCIAAKRLIVHKDIYDRFKAGFLARINSFNIGDPLQEDTVMGPLSSKNALEHVLEQINDALKAGATLTQSTASIPRSGFYLAPGILEGIQPSMDIYSQEIFAPIAMLFQVSNLDEAILLANDNPLGLSSVLFSNDASEHENVIQNVEAGSTYINRYASSDIRMPFGGIKKSGFGREMAREGLLAFTNLKTVIVAR